MGLAGCQRLHAVRVDAYEVFLFLSSWILFYSGAFMLLFLAAPPCATVARVESRRYVFGYLLCCPLFDFMFCPAP
ncbi:hypothetical protein BJ912DRAFT_992517 [Pholiota molesta]|nr:hypothetical protein BJ912DRAFT_992517 [Pholiota molesta]